MAVELAQSEHHNSFLLLGRNEMNGWNVTRRIFAAWPWDLQVPRYHASQ